MKIRHILATLLAATALSPALAQAQPDGAGERMERREARQAQREARQESRGDGGNWQAQRQQRQETRGDGGSGWQERRRGGWGGNAQPPAPVATPTPAPAPQQMERRWRGGMADGATNTTPRGDWNARRAERGESDGRRWGWRNAPPSGQLGNAPTPAPNPDRAWRRSAPPEGQLGGAPRVGDRNRDARRGDGWQGRNDRAERRDGWRGDGARGQQRWSDNGRGWDQQRRWNENRGWNGNRGWNDGRNWNREWRRDQRYDWQRYRFSNRNLYRARPYYAPRGWGYGYRRFSIGITLSNLLFDQRYWIADPWSYRLPEAYEPYRWVRYYDDVLLVDLRSGEVVDVIHDFFW